MEDLEMVKFNQEMTQILDGSMWVFATANAQGEPNAVPIHFKKILGDNKLLLVDNFMNKSKSNLSENQRVEFGAGILPKIIDSFCDSQFINQENYADILSELQEIFYLYKNETEDELTDDELLGFMKKQYEEICFGDLEYLRNTCLERYGRAVRSGYQNKMQSRLRDEYSLRDTDNEYSKLSEETRWEYEVYKMRLDDMF
jgi:hypothetical protein